MTAEEAQRHYEHHMAQWEPELGIRAAHDMWFEDLRSDADIKYKFELAEFRSLNTR